MTISERMEDVLTGDREPRTEQEARFVKLMQTGAWLYNLFDQMAQQRIAAGDRYISAREIWYVIRHKVRFERAVETEENPATGKPLKMADSHTPYMARLWEERNPEHAGIFRKIEIGGSRHGKGETE